MRAAAWDAMTIFGNRIMTPRLCLRKLEAEDLPYIVAWSNSREAHGEFLTPEKFDLARSREDLDAGRLWCSRSRTFVIETRDEELPIGTIHYWLRAEHDSQAVIALKIAVPSYRNRGFGTEAQKYLIIYLFTRLQLESVMMYTDIGNIPQQRCLAKLGFDLSESLLYEDAQVKRTGHLFRLDARSFSTTPVFHYVYE